MNGKRACIYYPDINPPSAWIKQSLLYWDTICSVVHADFLDIASNDLRSLLSEGLYEPVFADVIPRGQDGSGLRDELFRCIDNAELLGVDLSPAQARSTDFIYYGKLPAYLQDELIDRGLLQKQMNEISISSDLLGLILCLLAKYIASALSVGKDHYALYTASSPSASNNFKPFHSSDTTTATQLLLRDVLPVPDDSVPIGDILRFREKHYSRLLRFRRSLDRLIAELAKEEVDVPIATRAGEEFVEEISSISSELRRARIAIALLSVSVLVLPVAALAAPSHGLIPSIGASILKGIGPPAGIEIFRRQIRRVRHKKDFSYLQKAVRRFA